MNTPIDICRSYADQLNASGIRATVDPRDAVPPCVLFTPPDQVRLDMGCAGSADLTALLLVPGPGQSDAWAALDATLPAVLEMLPVEQIRSTSYTLDASGPMPAYELTFTHLVDWNK